MAPSAMTKRTRDPCAFYENDGNTNPKKVNEKQPLEKWTQSNISLDKLAFFLYEKNQSEAVSSIQPFQPYLRIFSILEKGGDAGKDLRSFLQPLDQNFFSLTFRKGGTDDE
jgi:hypothetical protein